ncbi:low temperature requirement protein A [Plantactinospora sp. B5E13]|uniref:low temperature requirement protein A n=1 Tax=Plantactinospora sp. B5E13 TaxID=3153758 RepID=UPI00325CD5F4
MTTAELPRILRKPGEPQVPAFLELFFDLVYIFMLSRLAAGLADDLSARNLLQTAVLLSAAWWVWVLTAWLTDIFDPRLAIIQATTLAVMFGALVMAIAVPHAFGAQGYLFVAAYFAIHVVRDAVLVPGTRVNRDVQARSARVFFWFLVTAPLWVAGVFVDGTARLVFWAVAVAIDLGSARLGWPTPRLGRTELASRVFTREHLSERHRQIFVVALGELVLTAGTGLQARDFAGVVVATGAAGFGGAVLLFLLYLLRVRRLIGPDGGGPVDRVRPSIYTSYTHLVMVSGVLLMSTGTTLAADRPYNYSRVSWVLVIFGGPALFLLGSCLFDHLVTGRFLWPRAIAIVVLVAIGPAMPLLSPLNVMLVANVVLLGTLGVELVGGRRRRAARR